MEPQQIHAHVVVVAAACTLAAPQDRQSIDNASAAAAALQFTAANFGFDVVAFRADFSASSDIRLRAPSRPHDVHDSDSSHSDLNTKLQIACRVFPFERRLLTHVVMRAPATRAFVRVKYELQDVQALSIDELEAAQQASARTLRDVIKRANATYYAHRTSLPVQLDGVPVGAAQRCCDDINRFFAAHDRDVSFVDASFAPAQSSLLGDNSSAADSDDTETAPLYALSTWRHVHDILDDRAWTFATATCRAAVTTDLQSPLPGHDALVCALAFLALDKHTWLAKLLPMFSTASAHQIRDVAVVCVRLCAFGTQWRDVVVDLFVPAFPLGNGLLGIASPRAGELYPMLIQKAYAKVRGSYRAAARVPTLTVLRELTGLPWVSAYDSHDTPSDTDNESVRTARQSTLQRLLCRRHRHHQKRRANVSSSSHCFVVSFRAVDSHHCAFPIRSSDATRGIELCDVGGAIRLALKRLATPTTTSTYDSDGDNTDHNEKRTCLCAWSDFFRLEPHVAMLLSRHCETRRLRHVFAVPQAKTQLAFEFALSVAAMTSVVIVAQLVERGGGSSSTTALASTRCRVALTLDAVGADFALTRLDVAGASTFGAESPDTELQVVLALGAGEYVVTATVDADAVDIDKATANSQDAERMLQLLFDCLDHDMDGAIALDDLEAFLRTHEASDVAAATACSERLERFVARFGRAPTSNSSAMHLLLDDLHDVYQFLAAADATAPSQTTLSSALHFAELVKSDLRYALQARTAVSEHSDSAVDMRDAVYELRCCVYSDVPLVDFVALESSATVPQASSHDTNE